MDIMVFFNAVYNDGSPRIATRVNVEKDSVRQYITGLLTKKHKYDSTENPFPTTRSNLPQNLTLHLSNSYNNRFSSKTS